MKIDGPVTRHTEATKVEPAKPKEVHPLSSVARPSAPRTLVQARDGFEKLRSPVTRQASSALPLSVQNPPLAARGQNQFLPPDVLASHDPAKVHEFITNSNHDAYQPKLDAKQAEIDAVQDKIDTAKAEPTDAVTRRYINTLETQKNVLVTERDKIVTERDTQTASAIKEFDTALSAAGGGSKDPAVASAAFDTATAKYQEYVFYHSSEPTTVSGPLYATGVGDGWPIEMNDITQGGLGDCYLLSSMAAIAQNHPELIDKMIKDNHDGTYTVTFHKEVPGPRGTTRDQTYEVTVDLQVPSGWNPAHAHPGDPQDPKTAGSPQEVWPLVIEKAYAEMKQSYGAMDGGWPSDALYTLTGHKAPKTDISTVSADDLAKYQSDGRNMVVDTCGADQAMLATYGLVGNHAYAIKGIKTDADGNKYLLLYNPWGVGNEPKPIPLDQAGKVIPDFYVN